MTKFDILFEEIINEFDDDFSFVGKMEYNGYTIAFESFDDQGDILYSFSIYDKNNKLILSSTDEVNGFGNFTKAEQAAKNKIDNILGNYIKSVKKELKCPYCGRKLSNTYTMHYSCLNCGKIPKRYIDKE